MKTTANKVVEIAKSQIGNHETGTNKNKYAADLDKTTMYNGKKQGVAWCDVFVDWCVWTACGQNVSDAEYTLCQPDKSCGAGCKYSMEYYKAKKRFYSSPAVGDQIFFTNGSTINHTGIVTAVSNGKVSTVEGNSDDAVKAHTYTLTSKKIAGYGRPRYETAAATTPTSNVSNLLSDAMINNLAVRVIRGDFGNGATRKSKLNGLGYGDIYSIVQKRVNQLLKK